MVARSGDRHEHDLSSDTETDGDLSEAAQDNVDGCSPLPDDSCEGSSAVSPAVTAVTAAADNSFVVIHSPEHGPGPSLKPGNYRPYRTMLGPLRPEETESTLEDKET